MSENRVEVQVAIEVPLAPEVAFPAVLDELSNALERRAILLEPAAGGRLVQNGAEVGRVVALAPGARMEISWRPPPWEDGAAATTVEVRVERVGAGSRVVVEHRGWGAAIGSAEEVTGWFASEVAAPFLAAATPAGFGDWLTDRRARRPSGAWSRETYRDPLFHWPNFRVILEELDLGPGDRLIEVGCGGGALLGEALKSGCRAAGVDHSPEMVRLAREANAAAVAEGRLDVREAVADRLPFRDGEFTRAAITGVLGFLPDPVAALAEVRRVLAPGGRLVALGSDPAWKGTPAAPEPVASRLRFWDDDELAALGRDAGFAASRVVRRSLERHAREAGVPEEIVPMFADPPAPFLVAERD